MVAISKMPTVADFKNAPELYIEQARTSDEMVLLTDGDTPRLVLQNVSAHQALLDRIEHLENIIALYKAELQCERGESRPAREALEELGRQRGILPCREVI